MVVSANSRVAEAPSSMDWTLTETAVAGTGSAKSTTHTSAPSTSDSGKSFTCGDTKPKVQAMAVEENKPV